MNALRSYTSRIRARFGRLGSDPETDWYFALSAFALILVAIVALNAYLALDVTRADEGAEAPATRTVTLDREALSEAADRIREEAQMPVIIPGEALEDPSI